MLRSMFGDEVFGQFEEDEAKQKQKAGEGGSGFLGIDSETWGMIGTLCSMLLMLALTGWFAFWALSKVKGDTRLTSRAVLRGSPSSRLHACISVVRRMGPG